MAGKRVNGSAGTVRTDDVEIGQSGPSVIGATDSIDEQDGHSAIPVVEPDSIESPPAEPAAKRGRGRPRGSTKATSGASKKEKGKDLTQVILNIHTMGALFLKAPGLNLEETEARMLAKMIENVNEVFGLPELSEKAECLVNVGVTLITVYGTRIFATVKDGADKKEEKKSVTIDADTGKVVH